MDDLPTPSMHGVISTGICTALMHDDGIGCHSPSPTRTMRTRSRRGMSGSSGPRRRRQRRRLCDERGATGEERLGGGSLFSSG
jgi:hypothetical protein